MNPEDLSLQETLDYLRKQWIKRFQKEEYQEVADAIEEIAENHPDTKFMEDPITEYLKSKSPNNHCEVYVEAMQGDFKAKMRGEHLNRGVN